MEEKARAADSLNNAPCGFHTSDSYHSSVKKYEGLWGKKQNKLKIKPIRSVFGAGVQALD